ncbi:hypothetical protein MKW98_024805 [Papaver atlanticum]|uniref:Nucleotide-diphospho-sugar transferase domain-containing protein n=1 Tax=Papaver atlanticum TaxID=357466 RepID=A0AAD4T762_9MAGN|nr:hypothetical protein MKW98_024805 [Papaver atlanticum]
MEYYKKNYRLIRELIIAAILIASVIYIFFCAPENITKKLSSFQLHHLSTSSNKEKNKTVIIALVNKAYVEGEISMLSLFLESFWLGGENTRYLVNHLLLVTVGQTAYERCKFLRLHCYRLVTDGVDFGGEKLYMSSDFIKMMWRRTLFLGDVLKRGYNFVFTDTDVIWLNNLFLRLSPDENEDIQISSDQFYGDPWSEQNVMNTGFYYARSNNKTIALFDRWYQMKDNSTYTNMKEQDVLVSLMRNGLFGELGMKVRFLETLYFSGFCEDSRDMNVVCTVHANCCRSIRAKVFDLTVVLQDWRKFKRPTAKNKTSPTVGYWSRYLGCYNSWVSKNSTKLNTTEE